MRWFTPLLAAGALISGACALTYRGADITSIPQLESSGKSFTDNGSKKPFENIMTAHGANTVRIRVWTAGTYNLNYALALAKRVKSAGMTLIVDLHYSDTCKLELKLRLVND
jgi:arabinogalactan endo-1,4-beta-galactosidase